MFAGALDTQHSTSTANWFEDPFIGFTCAAVIRFDEVTYKVGHGVAVLPIKCVLIFDSYDTPL